MRAPLPPSLYAETALPAPETPPLDGDHAPDGTALRTTWPIVEGTSLMHLHVNRGKRSLTLDLRTEAGVALALDLIREADVVAAPLSSRAIAVSV